MTEVDVQPDKSFALLLLPGLAGLLSRQRPRLRAAVETIAVNQSGDIIGKVGFLNGQGLAMGHSQAGRQ